MKERSEEHLKAEALDRALTAMQQRGLSPEQALSALPDSQAELTPLLWVAEIARAELSPPGPSQAYVQATKQRLANRLASREKRGAGSPRRALPRPRLGFLRAPAMALASLVLVVALLLSSTGVAVASAQSLPGDALYGVKRGLETARLSLTRTPQGRAALLMRYADERLEELQALTEANRSDDLDEANEAYDETLSELLEEVEAAGEDADFDEVEAQLMRHIEVLENLSLRLPIQAQAGIENALERSGHGLEVLKALEEGRKPNELAPGQNKEPGPPEGRGPEGNPPGPPGGGPPGQQGKDKGTPGPPEGKGPDQGNGGGPPEGGGPPDEPPGKGPK